MSLQGVVPVQRSNSLMLVLETPKARGWPTGRGLFAKEPIPAGTVIDTAPVLILKNEDYEKHIRHTELWHYSYNWPIRVDDRTTVLGQALVLGMGSMFNHSRIRQNVGWKRDTENQVIIYTTLRDIREGEELLISYGTKLTFEDVEAREFESDDEKDPLEALCFGLDEEI